MQEFKHQHNYDQKLNSKKLYDIFEILIFDFKIR